MGTLRLLLDVTTPGSFERQGMGVVAALEMRLMHAGVRTNVAPEVLGAAGFAEYRERYGVPINMEDLIGVTLGFSLLVVDGLEALRTPFRPEEAEDYYYLWRVYAHLKGVRVPWVTDPHADALPQTLNEARAVYALYRQRHYVGPTTYWFGWQEAAEAANPDGVALATAHVNMLARFLGGGYRREKALQMQSERTRPNVWYKLLVTVYVHLLIGEAASARVGVAPVFAIRWWIRVLGSLPETIDKLWGRLPKQLNGWIATWLLDDLIRETFRSQVIFPPPLSVQDLHRLARKGD
jgi:hypothetical protein